MAFQLDKRIVDILEQAVDSKIEKFKVEILSGNKKGEGYLGEITFVSLTNKKTGEDYQLIVKMVRPSEKDENREVMSATYFNEIHYYDKIFPALINFQKSFRNIKIFDNFPKCYATNLDEGFEKLVLENLKMKNYELHQKNIPLATKSFEKIFKMYADYHALTFAFKYHHPQEFHKITKDLNNNWIKVLSTNISVRYFSHFMGKALRYLEDNSEYTLLEKMEKYRQPLNIMVDSVTYNGSHGTILHGDCWSNNLMIKYDLSKEIDHIKMIDFQMGLIGSPVSDLSYSFYSGAAGKETLDNLEYLLKLYHNNLSENLQKYGCDPEKVYPYHILKEEWKKYCRFGFAISITLWAMKLATDLTEMATTNELMDGHSDVLEENDFGVKYDEGTYGNVILDLIRHMKDKEYL